MDKIMVLGDTHGRGEWVALMVEYAAKQGAEAIVQVGDFGYWEHKDKGSFLDFISTALVEHDVQMYWIDGNHEWHPGLWSKYTETNDEGFVIVRDNLFYIPRGHRWEWNGVSMMGVGGAVSIDREWRVKAQASDHHKAIKENKYRLDAGFPPVPIDEASYELWWPTETLTGADMALATSGGEVDILFTHDAPTTVTMALAHQLKNDDQSTAHRQLINEIVRAVRPKYQFHGHFHEFVTYDFPHDDGFITNVMGLARDGMDNSSAIVDLNKLQV